MTVWERKIFLLFTTHQNRKKGEFLHREMHKKKRTVESWLTSQYQSASLYKLSCQIATKKLSLYYGGLQGGEGSTTVCGGGRNPVSTMQVQAWNTSGITVVGGGMDSGWWGKGCTYPLFSHPSLLTSSLINILFWRSSGWTNMFNTPCYLETCCLVFTKIKAILPNL